MTCYLQTLEVTSGFDFLGDLRTFESKESRDLITFSCLYCGLMLWEFCTIPCFDYVIF